MKIYRWSQPGLGLLLGSMLCLGVAPTALAGQAAPNNGEEGSSTGTTNFQPNGVNPTLSPSQVAEITEAVFNQLSTDLGNTPNLSDNFESLLSGTPLSTDTVQAVLDAIQTVLSQTNNNQTSDNQASDNQANNNQVSNDQATANSNVVIRSRRPSTLSAVQPKLRSTMLEAGGSPETTALTFELVDQLDARGSAKATLAIAKLMLNLQGLDSADGITAQTLSTSIDAFNCFVNQLEPEVLERASKDSQILAIKTMLVSLSEAIASR